MDKDAYRFKMHDDDAGALCEGTPQRNDLTREGSVASFGFPGANSDCYQSDTKSRGDERSVSPPRAKAKQQNPTLKSHPNQPLLDQRELDGRFTM